jgi:hypothetical protein
MANHNSPNNGSEYNTPPEDLYPVFQYDTPPQNTPPEVLFPSLNSPINTPPEVHNTTPLLIIF